MAIFSGSANRRKQMMLELAKVDLANPAKSAVKSMSYSASRAVVSPERFRPPSDDRHKVMEKWVQAALNVVLGVKLPIDGVIKGDTRAALMRFQKQVGLPGHGFIDEKTLAALEEAVGLRAPRDGTFQGLGRLWQEDRRKQTQPPPSPPKKPEEQAQAKPKLDAAQDKGKEAGEKTADLDRDRQAAAHDFLQREAFGAMVRQAFARDWVREQLDRLGRQGDAALQAEMEAWLQHAQASKEPPEWLTQARTLAREKPEQATQVVRDAWLREHAGANAKAGATRKPAQDQREVP